MTESTETLFLDSGGLKPAYDIRPGVGHELLGVKLPQSGVERPAALGSEAERNGDGPAPYFVSQTVRVPFRISLFY